MSAHDLIRDIFSRHQAGVPGNERIVTPAQIDFLRRLCDADEEGAKAVHPGRGRSFVWAPSGRDKYLINEAEGRKPNKITRMANIVATGAGRLF